MVYTDISSTEGVSGLARIQYSKTPTDSNSWNTFNFGISGGLQQSGTTYTGTEEWTLTDRNDVFYFRAVDSAGNVSGISSAYNIKYDLTKPTINTPAIINGASVTISGHDNTSSGLARFWGYTI